MIREGRGKHLRTFLYLTALAFGLAGCASNGTQESAESADEVEVGTTREVCKMERRGGSIPKRVCRVVTDSN